MRIEEYTGMGSAEKVEIGTKCTIHFYSDAEPCEVVKVSKSGKTCYIRKNVVKADPKSTGGMGHQDWGFKEGDFEKIRTDKNPEPHLAEKPDGYTYYKVTKRKNGAWRTSNSNLYVAMNQWHRYYDWSF